MDTGNTQQSSIFVSTKEGVENEYIINNFIISDGYNERPEISLKHPYLVKGIAFIIVLNGSGRIKINLREYSIDKNTIMVMLPGCIVEILEFGRDILVEHLFFSVDFMTGLNIPKNMMSFTKIDEGFCTRLREEDINVLLDYHAFIVRQHKQTAHVFKKEITQNLLSAMMLEIHAFSSKLPNNGLLPATRQEEIFNKFMRLLYKYAKHERSVSFYADKLFLTPKYLAQIVKKVSGRYALEHIDEITIMMMKAALKSTSLTVSQISDEMNFPNPSFFCRFFKKHTGKTPIEYRELIY